MTPATDAELRLKLEEAVKFGVDFVLKRGFGGREYIEFGQHGCAYAQYFRIEA